MIQRGSSPRIRGKSLSSFGVLAGSGIIPANTGKIVLHRRRNRRGGDHPREYGENVRDAERSGWIPGSSPRIRGKWVIVRSPRALLGIIPANTGKISHFAEQRRRGWDHPREYGENPPMGSARVGGWGSSPRIRGKFPIG